MNWRCAWLISTPRWTAKDKVFGSTCVSGGARAVSIAWHATSSSTRHKSLFACFSSEKEDYCYFSEEKDVYSCARSLGMPPASGI
jgi:hypothetical protein